MHFQSIKTKGLDRLRQAFGMCTTPTFVIRRSRRTPRRTFVRRGVWTTLLVECRRDQLRHLGTATITNITERLACQTVQMNSASTI